MNQKILALLVLLVSHGLLVDSGLAQQGTAFTYQGRLQSGGSPANGYYDFSFALFNNPGTNSGQIGNTVTVPGVGVTNGLFTVSLDFGPVFAGGSNWLAIAVQTNGGSGFTPLSPLQALTPTPYALYAPNSGTAATANAVAGSNIVGAIAASQVSGGILTNGASGVNLSGSFTGDGGGLTNVTAASLAPGVFAGLTNVYASNGTYTFTVPNLASQMVVKLWGAGGGNDSVIGTDGGGGAFSQVTLNVWPGESFTVVVGQAGQSGGLGGGAGANDGSGGAGGNLAAGGGQASSLFQFTGSAYITKAVAGGGGGGSIFTGGNPGVSSGSGSGYASTATTTGVASLNMIGGNGGGGASEYGGGGGGYSGGSGGYPSTGEFGIPIYVAASGGGSLGDITISGSGSSAGNTGDPSYEGGYGSAGQDGLVVVSFTASQSTVALGETVEANGFEGNGLGLTNLSAENLTGIVPPANLPASVVTNNETGVTLAGTFSGNGSGLTSLPAFVVTNNDTGVTLSGSFNGTVTGNGNGLTNLNAAKLSGTVLQGNLGVTNSYTPTVGNGTQNFTTSINSGYYAKVGNLVYFEAWVTWSSKGSAASGNLALSLPPVPMVSQRAIFNVGYVNGLIYSGQLIAIASLNATNISLSTINPANGLTSQLPVGNCTASGELQVTGTYRWQ